VVRETSIRNMWEVVSDLHDDAVEAPLKLSGGTLPGTPQAKSPGAPAPRRTGRVKTRLLGFEHSDGTVESLGSRGGPASLEPIPFAVGWLVIVAGPGRGESFGLRPGVSSIGRGEGQAVCLDFGDTAISRENHALLAYDDETRRFYIGHSGKTNLVRLNGRPVLTTEEVSHGDRIRVGETTLMLVALCGADFTWSDGGSTLGGHAR
jgi:hypothetical protein